MQRLQRIIKETNSKLNKAQGTALLLPGRVRVLKYLKSDRSKQELYDSSQHISPQKGNDLDSEDFKSTAYKVKRIKRKSSANTVKKDKSIKTVINQETISALQEEIEYLWNVYRIDKHYQRSYLESLARLQITTYIQLMAKEIENLYNEKSVLQNLMSSIEKREAKIKQIAQFNTFLASNPNCPENNEKVICCLM